MPASLCSCSLVLSSEMPLFSLFFFFLSFPRAYGCGCYRFVTAPQEGRDCTSFHLDLDHLGLLCKMVPVAWPPVYEGMIKVLVLLSPLQSASSSYLRWVQCFLLAAGV